jgi:hypothetical protein
MKVNKRVFIAKELLNMPDCVSLIMKEIKTDFISFQKLCHECNVKIQSERDRLDRHDLMKIKDRLIEKLKEIDTQKSNSSPVKYNNEFKLKEKSIMSHGPIFDKMANQKEKIKFVSTPMRD